ncbi:glucose-specific PTS transporter subunit IIBC [Deinococcus cellulosilyticus]|uniref:PTS glucose transporter subunit IIABC n=1 Tax=Deinococcus cellulosilyticus (strain DSM 18568 / NBRC 106333 / KACC 11606 / 5516J-15) TaxID=1223518 RepID=A0A511MVG8_DEIC1|nr:glucose-specific PTS transporter subunit IIBC [Deinococcus cellulosilyticus]GEM44572.1 PTS glucose transporter subunit IIABC [Deinococcus cellulosilyticus NBRC 106333 = KACC 11606]
MKDDTTRLFAGLQQIGKALMLPVAVLPAAGLLVGIGTHAASHHWLPQGIASIMLSSGDAILHNIPLLFAVGVAIGLTAGEGVAALAALVGFLVMNSTMGSIAELIGFDALKTSFGRSFMTQVMGVKTIDTGVFGGMLIGILSAVLYNRYHTIRLHPSLGFFSGKRFIPILTALSAVLVGTILAYIWVPIQTGLDDFTRVVTASNPEVSSGLFGFLNRMLIPFGIHHIWNNPFLYSIGDYVTASGDVVRGDSARFLGGDPSAGLFMTGFFPVMMFGLPAAALAIVHTAKPGKKAQVAGIMFSAALSSFLTGITEPIEFAFMFVSPLLYGIHAVLTGLAFLIMNAMEVKLGFSFSAGFIDYVLLWGQAKNPVLLLPVGATYAVLYYFIFRFAIVRLNIPTPGRDDDTPPLLPTQSPAQLASEVLSALGGSSNIEHLEACITRLRIRVKSMQHVQHLRLKDLGAVGVVRLGQNLQVVFGGQSEQLSNDIHQLMHGERLHPVTPRKVQQVGGGVFIQSPMRGRILPLAQVPDDVFSQKLMGDGFAIDPIDGEVYAPCDGTIEALFPTMHAVALLGDSGHEILIHVGIDTVHLGGEGFKAHVKQGDRVKAGDLLLSVNLQQIRDKVPSLITPVVFTNLLPENRVLLADSGVSIV